MYQYIFDLRLSEDNIYIFYTLGEGSFMNTGDYRYNFYIVDTKTGSRIHLKDLIIAITFMALIGKK